MMMADDLVSFFETYLDVNFNTARARVKHLRAADPPLLNKGRIGRGNGAPITNSGAVVMLLANVLSPPHGGDSAELVRSVYSTPCDQPLTVLPSNAARGLTLPVASTIGEALCFLLNDLRRGAFAHWTMGEPWDLKVSFESGGAFAFISLQRGPKGGIYGIDLAAISMGFARPGAEATRNRLIERNVTLGGELFVKLANELGPLEAKM